MTASHHPTSALTAIRGALSIGLLALGLSALGVAGSFDVPAVPQDGNAVMTLEMADAKQVLKKKMKKQVKRKLGPGDPVFV